MTERYARKEGYRYSEIREYASTAEIAKAIRADIKQAKAEGLLPKNWKYSVRSRNFAGGCAIDVTVDGPRAEIVIDEDLTRCPLWASTGESACRENFHYGRGCPGARHYTDEAEAAEVTLKRIHNAYNYDGSEPETDYFDVRYYGSVEFDYRLWDISHD